MTRPRSTSAAARRRRLLQMLVAHGLMNAAAQACRALGVQLREETLRRRGELGALVDAETGAQLGHVVAGTNDRLELGPILRAMAPGQRYACVHTHPADTSFSPDDVGLLLRFPAISVVVAI